MLYEPVLAETELITWTRLVNKGIASSISGLSGMVGRELSVSELNLENVSAGDTFGLLGGYENPVVGVYLRITGDAGGYLVLLHKPEAAFELIDCHKGLTPGSTRSVGEVELSLLGEMGNITGALFLNVMADAANLLLTPSPPVVIMDMAGVVLDIATARIMQEQGGVFTVKATYGAAADNMRGTFLLLPTLHLMRVVLTRARMN